MLSLAAQGIVIGPVCDSGVCNGPAVSEPYYSQCECSVCVSLSAFFHNEYNYMKVYVLTATYVQSGTGIRGLMRGMATLHKVTRSY